jgi:SSS family transporter
MPPTSNPLIPADYLVIAGFFAVMLAIGAFFARRMRDAQDYFAAGKHVPWWLSSVSYWMSSFSAFAFVAHSALAYQYGLVPLTIWWTSAAMMIVTAHLVAARWRRVGTTSPVEFIEQRYGPTMRQSLSWLGSILIVLDDAMKIMATGIIVSASLGFPANDAILWCGLIMLTYTLLGGLWAVLITDMVQFVVMLAAILMLVPLTLHKLGDFHQLVDQLPANFFRLTGGKYTPAYLTLLALMSLMGFCSRWSLVQRFYVVASDADARKVCYLVAALNVIVAPLLLFPAVAATVFLPGVEDPDRIYGLLCRELLPVGMLGMLIAAIFSATMSSLSSDYNAVASVLTTDVYRRLIRTTAADSHYVAVGRWLTLLVGLSTVGIAMLMNRYGERLLLFDKMVIIFVVLGPTTILPVLAGLLTRRASNGGAICGMVTGITLTAAARLFGPKIMQALTGDAVLPESAHMLLGIASTIAGLVLGTWLWPGTPEERENVDRFFAGLTSRPADVEIHEPAGDAVSPATIVGLAVAALGGVLLLVVPVSVPWRDGWLGISVGAAMILVGALLVAVPGVLSSRR